MRTLNIPLDDAEFAELDKSKGDMSWREFILTLRGNKHEIEGFEKEEEQ